MCLAPIVPKASVPRRAYVRTAGCRLNRDRGGAGGGLRYVTEDDALAAVPLERATNLSERQVLRLIAEARGVEHPEQDPLDLRPCDGGWIQLPVVNSPGDDVGGGCFHHLVGDSVAIPVLENHNHARANGLLPALVDEQQGVLSKGGHHGIPPGPHQGPMRIYREHSIDLLHGLDSGNGGVGGGFSSQGGDHGHEPDHSCQ